MGTTGFAVEFVGLRDTQRALRTLDPEVGRALDRAIKGILRPVQDAAKALVPTVALSGWQTGGRGEWSTRLGYDPSTIVGGIKLRKGGRRARGTATRVGYRLTNESPAGAVFEMAGRRSGGSSPQGAAFIRNLNARHGGASRVVWRAWDRRGGNVEAAITREVEQAQTHVQQLLAAASDRG